MLARGYVLLMFETMDGDGNLATPTEACREYARTVGADRPERPWILTDFDTWERNPYYRGPRCIANTHPESVDEEFTDTHAECADAGVCVHGFDPNQRISLPIVTQTVAASDDDIPF